MGWQISFSTYKIFKNVITDLLKKYDTHSL